jgi:hypothetical protein
MKCDRRWYNDGRVRLEVAEMERARNAWWAEIEPERVDFYSEHPMYLMRITLPPGPNGYDPLLEAL